VQPSALDGEREHEVGLGHRPGNGVEHLEVHDRARQIHAGDAQVLRHQQDQIGFADAEVEHLVEESRLGRRFLLGAAEQRIGERLALR